MTAIGFQRQILERTHSTSLKQRLILNFIIDNSGKEFVDCCVTKTFRKVHEAQASHASSYSFFHLDVLQPAGGAREYCEMVWAGDDGSDVG
jgi:hypothetical protein